jgi:hypothetical protein
MEFNINAGSVFDMELMESSFDLMQKPIVFKSFLDANSFVLTDAVVIKQTIKPTPKAIETPIVALPLFPKRKVIIATYYQSQIIYSNLQVNLY